MLEINTFFQYFRVFSNKKDMGCSYVCTLLYCPVFFLARRSHIQDGWFSWKGVHVGTIALHENRALPYIGIGGATAHGRPLTLSQSLGISIILHGLWTTTTHHQRPLLAGRFLHDART